jgi:hypothetical protein
MAKIKIRQVDGEKGIFTEILIGGRKIDGVRSYELKQKAGELPVLTIDLNAFEIATDLRVLLVNQDTAGEIKSIRFKDGYEVEIGSPVTESQ